jgi:hypothetical protein
LVGDARIIVTIVLAFQGENLSEYQRAFEATCDGAEQVADDIAAEYPQVEKLRVEATG